MQIIFGALFKRYFLIDQQKARNFVHFSEYLSDPLLFYATQLINYFLNLKISTNHNILCLEIKRKGILELQYH